MYIRWINDRFTWDPLLLAYSWVNSDEKGCWFIEGGIRDWLIVWLTVWLMDWLTDFTGSRTDCPLEMCKPDILLPTLNWEKGLITGGFWKSICRNTSSTGNLKLHITFGAGTDAEILGCDRSHPRPHQLEFQDHKSCFKWIFCVAIFACMPIINHVTETASLPSVSLFLLSEKVN